MAKTGVRGISYDKRDSLYDAGFQMRGLRFRKKFKTLELAREWIERTREEVRERLRERDLQRPAPVNIPE